MMRTSSASLSGLLLLLLFDLGACVGPTVRSAVQGRRHVSSISAHRNQEVFRLRGGALAEGISLITDEADLEAVLDDAGSTLVVVDFYAEWCGPCKKLAPVIEELAVKAGDKVQFFKVDVDQSRELAAARGVKSMPTLQFFRNGEQVNEIIGGDKAALRLEIQKEITPRILRIFSSERLLVISTAIYLIFPWQRVFAC